MYRDVFLSYDGENNVSSPSYFGNLLSVVFLNRRQCLLSALGDPLSSYYISIFLSQFLTSVYFFKRSAIIFYERNRKVLRILFSVVGISLSFYFSYSCSTHSLQKEIII